MRVFKKIMKFWKILSSLIDETLPEWRDKFLSYKDLKKQLKIIYPEESAIDCSGRPCKRQKLGDGDDGKEREIYDGDCEVSKEVIDFVELLEEEIDKFNGFFVDNEENYIIRLKVLSFLFRFFLSLSMHTCKLLIFASNDMNLVYFFLLD